MGPLLEADILEAGGVIETDVRQHLVEKILDQHSMTFPPCPRSSRDNHSGIGQALEGQCVAHLADHRAAPDPERITRLPGCCFLRASISSRLAGSSRLIRSSLTCRQSSGVTMLGFK